MHGSQLNASFLPFDPAYKNKNIWEFQGRVVGETISWPSPFPNLITFYCFTVHCLTLSSTSHYHLFAHTGPVGNFIWGRIHVLLVWPLDNDSLNEISVPYPLPRHPSTFPPLAQYGAILRLTTARAWGSSLDFCFSSTVYSPEQSGDGSQVATMQQDSETKR